MLLTSINGQQIWFEDSGGSGPVVLLAHGFLMDTTMFDALADTLRGSVRVVRWDARGFGRTVYDGNPFSHWGNAADALVLMDRLGLETAFVGGQSQGGAIAMRTALLAPTRVEGLF